MSKLITMHNNQPVVSHRVIAESTENQEASIRNLINKHILDFEEFGKAHFKNVAIKNAKNKVNEAKTYFLNEQQTTLLMTYLRNTSLVRAFKVKLVKEFYKLREELYHKKNDIVITCTTDAERVGTLETQLYMLKNENRELRRAINRMTYNENYNSSGLSLGYYVNARNNKDYVIVYKIENSTVYYADPVDGLETIGVEWFKSYFKKVTPPAPKMLKNV